MSEISKLPAVARDRAYVPTHDDHGSRVATGLATAGVFAATTAMPGGWERSIPRQGIVTLAGAAIGFGFGSVVAEPAARHIGHGDPFIGGVALASVGTLIGIAGHHVPATEGAWRDAGAIIKSTGLLAGAAGAATAATSLVGGDGGDRLGSVLGTGAVVGGGLGALTLGTLALTGGLRAAPSVAEAARSVVEPLATSAAKWTPELAHADYLARDAAAEAKFLELPGTDAKAWEAIGKGRTFLRGVATTDDIRATTGLEALREPRRLVVGAPEEGTPRELADLMLERFDAAGGASYGTIHVVSPAAIGDTDEVVPLAVEHATRGDSITLMTQAVQSEPYFVLHKQGKATRTLELVLEGLQERIAKQPADQRSKLLVSALCYGSLSPARLGPERLAELGVDHALLEGPPALSRASRELAGELERGERPGLLAFTRQDLDAAADSGKAAPRFTMYFHRDDALRAGPMAMLVPPSDQEGRPFLPIASALNAFGDFGADTPAAAGHWLEVGHQFQATGVSSANAAFGLGLDPSRRAVLQDHAVTRDLLRDLGRVEQPKG